MDKTEGDKLIEEALRVYKIPREHLFASGIDSESGEAVIVTKGGKKLRHLKGEKAKFKLIEVQITGELPEEERAWIEQIDRRIPVRDPFRSWKRKEI